MVFDGVRELGEALRFRRARLGRLKGVKERAYHLFEPFENTDAGLGLRKLGAAPQHVNCRLVLIIRCVFQHVHYGFLEGFGIKLASV